MTADADPAAGRDWLGMKPREFDAEAPEVQLSLFGAPDDCGSFGTLFDEP
jgi:hypothetical protein